MDTASDSRAAPVPRLRSRLRAETAELHAALEARLDLLCPQLSVDRYLRVLLGFHGYHSVVEPRLAALSRDLRVSLPIVTRAGALKRDLLSLGLAPESIAAGSGCGHLPTLQSHEQLAGCLYVLEGSRLGGKVISRALEQHLGLTGARGCSFFAGENEPDGRWSEVTTWLESLAADADIEPLEIIASAADTFRSLHEHLAKVGALL